MSQQKQKDSTDISTKDESNADCNEVPEKNTNLIEETKADSKASAKRPSYLERIIKQTREHPDNIILALDRNLGIDMFNIPDEVSESQSSISMLTEDMSPVQRSKANSVGLLSTNPISLYEDK